jgi:hypothetical protein
MSAITKYLAGGIAAAALAGAAPAAAQYYPGYASPYGYGYNNQQGYGYNQQGYGNGYGPQGYANSQAMVSQCANAVQSRLNGGYGSSGYNSYGYGGGRVLGVSRVEPRGDGGFDVRGVASSGYSSYGYAPNSPNLVWRCRTDFRGLVVDLDVDPARSNYGSQYNNSPYDYSPYGYQRY